MVNPFKAFGNIDSKKNLFMLVLIALSFIGTYWLLVNEVRVGTIYFFMIIGSIGIFVLGLIFTKGDNLGILSKFIRVPFAGTLGLGVISYWIGAGLPFLLEGIFKVINSLSTLNLSVTSFSIPLFGAGRTALAQSFTSAQFQQSMPWKLFNVVFNASVVEEFTFSFAIMILGVLVGIFLLKFIFNGDAPIFSNKNFVLIFAIIFASVLFMLAHQLNATYTTGAFIFALVFKLITLIGIYKFGLFLTLVIGYHASNNLIWMLQTDGFANVANGFVSYFGLFFVFLLVFSLIYIIRNFSKISQEFSRYIKS